MYHQKVMLAEGKEPNGCFGSLRGPHYFYFMQRYRNNFTVGKLVERP